MRSLSALIFLAISGLSFASNDEIVDCSIKTPHLEMYARDTSHMDFKQAVNFKDVLRERLIAHAKDIERIANWCKEYSGPDQEYIPLLIELQSHATGGEEEFSCLWSRYQEGDVIRFFEDNESMVFREGYALFRGRGLIAYFYTSIKVV